MKERIKKVIKHPLIYGSTIAVGGSLFSNFFNFLFNLFMSRNLSIAEYGTLASLMSLIGFPALAGTAIMPLVVRFAGNYFATGQLTMVRGLYLKINKFFIGSTLIFILIYIICIPQISAFFHIDNTFILLLAALIILIALMGVINMAFLQAKLSFGFLGILNTLSALLKFVLGMALVFLGFSVNGAIFAMLASGVFTFLCSFFPIKFVFNKTIGSPAVSTKELFDYGLPSLLTLIGLTSFISVDIMLVKHFFSATEAGVYAGLSLIGRVIFYLTSPIGSVMFPLMVQKHARKEKFTNTFLLSLIFIFLPSLALTIFYFVFPNFTILFFLKKTEYLTAASLLGYFGIFILLYNLLTLLSNFYLSIKKTKVFIPILVGAFAQIGLIYLYHSSFMQIIMISTCITFLLVLGLLLYYPYATKK